MLVEDASGGEAYYYGNQGEVVKTVRSVMVSTADVRTYVYGTTYDSWNRVRTMTYPDGEVVTYAYNAAGQIVSVKSNKQGKEETIVEEVGYDKEGHTVYTRLGNGTETTYTYDRQRERLQEMNLTAAGAAVMTNKYRYDAVDNILGITNAIDPAKAGGKSQLGGAFSHTYAYDELNRLITASGKAKSASYEMAMTFGRMSEPLTKVQKVDSTRTAQSYDFTYRYEDDSHPTAPTQVGHDHYTYDANGNPILVENDSLNTERRMYWDEDNRLMVLSDNGKTSRYTYNAAGERIVKSHGDLEGVYINGAPQGISFHETEDYTIYPAPIITVTKNRFTKHYFIGDKRVASKLGVGKFSNVYGIGGNNITAGQKDYAARMMQIEKQREEYYKQLGTPPGVPTMKGATADPDNTGIGYNSIITDLGDHSVPEGWIQHPKFNGKEFDQETGLYYYGARYMNPVTNLWYGVDALVEKYPNLSSYNYCANNPVKFIDRDGNYWFKTDKKYFYDSLVTSQEDATNKYGKETKYLFAAGTLFAKSGAYSYDLDVGGHVKDTYTGEYIAGQISTPAGSTIVNNNAYFNCDELNFREKWAQTDNCIGKLLYGMANDIFVTAQIFDFGNWAGSGATNPLTGAEVQFYNIDGSPNYKPADAIVPTLATKGVGGLGDIAEKNMGKVAKNVMSSFNKLNAAQFSSSFNKSFAGFSPKVRGHH